MANENTVDQLMDLDPLSLTAENIDAIIAHHRKARSNAASGIKAKKDSGPTVDLTQFLEKLTGHSAPSNVPTVRRR